MVFYPLPVRLSRGFTVRLWSVILGLHAAALTQATLALETIDKIAFGSCLRQHEPQPIWDAIIASRPDIFLFIGDNIYADTKDIGVMRNQYMRLGTQPGYRRLRASCRIHATWDDHDYGANDAGAEFPMRSASEQAFLDFFAVPQGSAVRSRPGVYDAHVYGPTGRGVQVILLDTRYFRGPLKRGLPTLTCPRVRYLPNDDREATLLGEAQWTWLEEQLRKPAKLRVLASSIQVIPDQHCFEKWGNFPHERERLFRLIRETQANGIILISGDRHFADISRLDERVVGYPLYEITSSGMNSAANGWTEANPYRVISEGFHEDNFGLIKVRWSVPNPLLRLEIRNADGDLVRYVELRLESLHPAQRKEMHQ
jgi:alkaline phosphatase D